MANIITFKRNSRCVILNRKQFSFFNLPVNKVIGQTYRTERKEAMLVNTTIRYNDPVSAGTEFRRQILTSKVDPCTERIKNLKRPYTH